MKNKLYQLNTKFRVAFYRNYIKSIILSVVALLFSSHSLAQCDGPCTNCGTTLFTVTASSSTNFTIDGQADPPLTFFRGCTYTFAVTTPGHPFYIKTTAGTGSGNQYDGPTTNQGTTSLNVVLTIGSSAPSTLFYQCGIHAAMVGTITIKDCPDITPPIALCKDTTVFLDAIGLVIIDTSFIDNGSSDNCGIVSMSLDTTMFDCDDIGDHSITMTVTDESSNSNTCTATVTIRLQENIFVDAILLALFGDTGVYQAANLIESDATIKALNTVIFKAGNEILLHPQFTTEPGAIFEALIETCMTTNSLKKVTGNSGIE